MIALFTGGSGSGKSEMAEAFACRRAEGGKLYYFATMRVWGEEGRARVEKHRRQREGKGFETIECPDRLPRGIAGGVILLECLSNRLANAMFGENEPDPVGVILSESMKYLVTGKWWLALFPGLMLVLTVMLFDLLGECLRKLTDPGSVHR